MTSIYVHGSEPDEQRRLSLLNDLLNDECLRPMALRGTERVVDFGSGLGQFARAMARRGCRVVGIEREERQRRRAIELAAASGESALVDFRAGDGERPPLAPEEFGSFDLAHARFLLEHLRDPGAVVATMLRSVRFGGHVVLFDDDHDALRLWPHPPAVLTWWHAYWRYYEKLGNDPLVGRKLVALLHNAGATPVRSGVVNFGGCAGEATFQHLVDNFVGVMETATPDLLANALLDEPTLHAGRTQLAAWRRRPDAALWYPLPYAIGRRDA